MSDTSFIITATDRTKAAFTSVEGGLKSISSQVFSLKGALLGLAGAGGFGALIRMSATSADVTGKLANKIGIASEEFGGLAYAMKQTAAVSEGAFGEALTKSTKRLAEFATTGGGAAARWIQHFQFDVKELQGLAPDQLFMRYAEAIRGLNTRGEQLAAISALMGDESRNMIAAIDAGPEVLREMAQEAKDFGIAINAVDTAKITAANDELGRAGAMIKGVGTTLAVELSPYVAAMARHFADAGRAHNGFRDHVINGTEKIVTMVAYAADVWRGLQVVWKGLEVIFAKFADATWSNFNAVVGRIYQTLAKLPVVGEHYQAAADMISGSSHQAGLRVAKLESELKALVEQPMPSANVKRFFAEVREEAEASALKVAQSTAAMGGFGGADDASGGLTERQREQLAQRLTRLNESLMSEHERLQLHYEQQQLLVDEAFEAQLISQDERYALLEQLQADHHERMNAIAYKGMADHEKFATAFRRGDVRNALAFGAEMTAGVAQNNKTLFDINKGFALASTAISLPDAVVQSFQRGGGYPWGLVPAGLMLAKGMAQINAIRKTQYTGAGGNVGGAPSLSGGGSGGGSTVNTVPTMASDMSQTTQVAPQRIYVEFEGGEDTTASLRDWREEMRRIQELYPDAQMVF